MRGDDASGPCLEIYEGTTCDEVEKNTKQKREIIQRKLPPDEDLILRYNTCMQHRLTDNERQRRRYPDTRYPKPTQQHQLNRGAKAMEPSMDRTHSHTHTHTGPQRLCTNEQNTDPRPPNTRRKRQHRWTKKHTHGTTKHRPPQNSTTKKRQHPHADKTDTCNGTHVVAECCYANGREKFKPHPPKGNLNAQHTGATIFDQ